MKPSVERFPVVKMFIIESILKVDADQFSIQCERKDIKSKQRRPTGNFTADSEKNKITQID